MTDTATKLKRMIASYESILEDLRHDLVTLSSPPAPEPTLIEKAAEVYDTAYFNDWGGTPWAGKDGETQAAIARAMLAVFEFLAGEAPEQVELGSPAYWLREVVERHTIDTSPKT